MMEELSVLRISSEDLACKIGNQCRVLLLDCRPFISFNDRHICSSCNVHCPTILKRRSGGFMSLENMIPCPQRRNTILNGHYTDIVVYDQTTTDIKSAEKDSNLYTVLQSLKSQLDSVGISYLEGGFDEFSSHYPLYTASPISSIVSESCNNSIKSPSESTKMHPVEVMPHLYIGDSIHASNLEILRDLGITSVLNVSSNCPNHFTDQLDYMTIPVRDNQMADLRSWFQDAINFIDSVNQNNGKVLVHCQAGISRSATICLAFIMNKLKLSLDDAFELLLSRRGVISPNMNFLQQLQAYELELRDNEKNSRQLESETASPPSEKTYETSIYSSCADVCENSTPECSSTPSTSCSKSSAFVFDFPDSSYSEHAQNAEFTNFSFDFCAPNDGSCDTDSDNHRFVGDFPIAPLQQLPWVCGRNTPTSFDFPNAAIGMSMSAPGTPLLSPS